MCSWVGAGTQKRDNGGDGTLPASRGRGSREVSRVILEKASGGGESAVSIQTMLPQWNECNGAMNETDFLAELRAESSVINSSCHFEE